MPANDFLVFGVGGSANVMSQADWAALAQRLTGFQAGVAPSAQFNKAWRQSSIMAAVLAQFIADLTGQPAVDDGTTATLLANLKAAVSAQSVSVVGMSRNAQMLVAAASSSAAFTADELIVESALGGSRYCLASVNQTINLATTGAGGMDTGTPPASGYVGIYEIYNPTTNTRALLGQNATSVLLPEIYGGANMPAGYTASALVAVWPTDGTGKLVAASMSGRRVRISTSPVLTSSVQQTTPTSLSLSGAVPKNARRARAWMAALCTATGTAKNMTLASSAAVLGAEYFGATASLAGVSTIGMVETDITTPQTLYYTAQTTGGTATFSINIVAYEF